MTYSGRVTVGGPADVHELKDLMITKVAVGAMDNNAYLLRCRATDEQLNAGRQVVEAINITTAQTRQVAAGTAESFVIAPRQPTSA